MGSEVRQIWRREAFGYVKDFVFGRYLGLLHMEVFHQRLHQEYGASIITTTPTVPYSLKHADGSTEEIQNPSQVC